LSKEAAADASLKLVGLVVGQLYRQRHAAVGAQHLHGSDRVVQGHPIAYGYVQRPPALHHGAYHLPVARIHQPIADDLSEQPGFGDAYGRRPEDDPQMGRYAQPVRVGDPLSVHHD